ncbi:MAG: hypothetical protein ACT4O9_04985 [Blastocatellia bacterium]
MQGERMMGKAADLVVEIILALFGNKSPGTVSKEMSAESVDGQFGRFA